jgi:hypothetical protein
MEVCFKNKVQMGSEFYVILAIHCSTSRVQKVDKHQSGLHLKLGLQLTVMCNNFQPGSFYRRIKYFFPKFASTRTFREDICGRRRLPILRDFLLNEFTTEQTRGIRQGNSKNSNNVVEGAYLIRTAILKKLPSFPQTLSET